MNYTGIFIVAIKKKYGFGSNKHVLQSKKALDFSKFMKAHESR